MKVILSPEKKLFPLKMYFVKKLALASINRVNTSFIISILVLSISSCGNSNRNTIIGRWKLVDVNVACTSPIEDSLSKAKLGLKMSTAEILKEEAQSFLKRRKEFIFDDDKKFSVVPSTVLDDYKYIMKDSFVAITNWMHIVVYGYKVHFITSRQLQLTEEMVMKRHMHTYTVYLERVDE